MLELFLFHNTLKYLFPFSNAMQKIYSNLKKGELKVKVTNPDDLWYLSQIIEPHDLVKAATVRKIKLGESTERGSAVIRRTVTLTLTVENVEFHEYQNSLRVSGKITEGPEDIPRGSYHTISVEEDSILPIIKEQWLKYQIDKIHEALEEHSQALICVFDREEAYFALLKKYKYELLLELKGTVQKKEDPTRVASTFYRQIIAQLKVYSERYNSATIIVASPSFWKEYLLQELKDIELRKKIFLASCSSATLNAIDEVIKSKEVQQLLKKDRVAKESKIVETLLSEIAKNNVAAYGIADVEQAAIAGAVQQLLVADSLIRKMRLEGSYQKLEHIMKQAEATGATVTIISVNHEAGKQLEGLGSIGAILRYKMNYRES